MFLNSKRSERLDKAKIHLLAFMTCISTSLFFFDANAQDLERKYSIQADFRSIQNRTFSIQMDATLTNHTKTKISELQWILYPNRFLRQLPNLNDLNYRRIYPNGLSTGYLNISSLTVNGNEVSKMQPIALAPFPPNTLYQMRLDQPILPNESRVVHFVMELKVPEKYGSFGYYAHRLTMSGGWTPYLASYRDGEFHPTDQSPASSWEVKILADQPYVVGSQMIAPTAEEKTFNFQNLGQFPIQIGQNIQKQEFSRSNVRLQVVLAERKPEKILDPLDKLFNPWADYVAQLKLASESNPVEITIVQAPLREMLAVDAQNMSFFSDRAYKVISGLRSFHNVPMARMMFSQLFFPQTIRKENSRDYYWVDELIANALTEDFVATQNYKYRDARKIGAVRMFSMLPIIDELIHTPQFAFFDVFYNFVYPFDPVRDEVSRFDTRRQYGSSVLAHMNDELGTKVVSEIVYDYIQNPTDSFLQVAEKHTGLKLADRFENWTAPRPELNYLIKKIKSKKTDKGYLNQITIEKEVKKPMHEPVEIEVGEKNGKKQTVVWNSENNEDTIDVNTDSKVKSVEIDPRQRLLETKLSDNRKPAYWKFVLTQLFAQYDYNANQPEIFFESQLRKKYGGQDRYLFGGFYQADSYGVNVGYTRLFGQALDRIRLAHGVGISYSFSRLSTDNVVVATSPPSLLRVTDSGFLTSVTASYFFGNQVSYTNPLQGEYGGINFTYGSAALGGDFRYYQVSVSGAKIFQLHPSHLLAFRSYFGNSGPDNMPTQVEFRLGGINSIRGLGLDDDKYRGRNILLFSGEYRHFLVQDCDVNLGVLRVRDIQGALFADAGRTTDTLQERANQLAFGSSASSTSLVDVFKVQDFETDAGYGLRFHVDYLGVSPGLLRFDVAKSISDSSQPFRFYFGVIQSF